MDTTKEMDQLESDSPRIDARRRVLLRAPGLMALGSLAAVSLGQSMPAWATATPCARYIRAVHRNCLGSRCVSWSGRTGPRTSCKKASSTSGAMPAITAPTWPPP